MILLSPAKTDWCRELELPTFKVKLLSYLMYQKTNMTRPLTHLVTRKQTVYITNAYKNKMSRN